MQYFKKDIKQILFQVLEFQGATFWDSQLAPSKFNPWGAGGQLLISNTGQFRINNFYGNSNHYGIRGHLHSCLGLITSFLTCRSQLLLLKVLIWKVYQWSAGSPKAQCSVHYCSSCSSMTFQTTYDLTPDCLLTTVSSTTLSETMQTKRHYKNILAEWENKWGMEFHLQKCGTPSVVRSLSPSNIPIS